MESWFQNASAPKAPPLRSDCHRADATGIPKTMNGPMERGDIPCLFLVDGTLARFVSCSLRSIWANLKSKGGRPMDQRKNGAFLKELRKEKALTQEQLAEILNVSRRTVSRWETGSNMPDLDILVEIADFYGVDIRELLDGERRSDQMNQEMKETVLKVADYSNEDKLNYTKRLHVWFIVAMVCLALYFVTLFFEPETSNAVFSFVQGMMLGFSFMMIVIGVLITGKNGHKLREKKMRHLG
ncbi:helix-turn-helix domain-containing protein [Slackia heliotrinireducens]|uniref:helix-turn-helix domain-containing protein n=1 Tax=Slackia heliotrinireducens TaxID=84110 RepID=UPI003315A76E